MTPPKDPTALYLDLLKKTLSYLLWDEPAVPMETFNYQRPPFRRFLLGMLCGALRRVNVQLARPVVYSDEHRESGMTWPLQAHTMIGLRRLDNNQFCMESVLEDAVPGDVIETGVWRGGACIFMRGVLAAHGITDRRVFVADSFAGLPPPEKEAYPQDEGDQHYTQEFLAVSKAEVEKNFRLYGLLDEQVVFLEGWFKDTLPAAPIEALSVLRLDGDMYQSTMEALQNLYPKLSSGGYCIIDDYGIETCREAVTDFRAERDICCPIQEIDPTSVYWRKGSS
jgi:hypothetical protein